MRRGLALLLIIVAALGTDSDAQAKTTNRQETSAHSGVHINRYHRSGFWIYVEETKYCQTGITASGTYTHWGTVSSTFRFGTHFSIPHYSSWATAEDTGGAVGPGHLDLYDPLCWRDIQFGVRYNQPVFVYSR